jgi:hypothetical protein
LTMAGTKLVDVEVLDVVVTAAKARLSIVQAEEIQHGGVATTTLANVGRKALLKWKPPSKLEGTANGPTRYRKVTTEEIRAWLAETTGKPAVGTVTKDQRTAYREAHSLTVSPFRFTLPTASYAEIKSKIHSCGLSVAGVVQDALEKFARTGKY